MTDHYILGLSAYYHDSAAALIRNGEIIAAAQEERFTRIKGDNAFPLHAINYCLEEAGIAESAIDTVAYYENPLVKFERLITTYHLTAPQGLRSYLQAIPDWIVHKLWVDRDIHRQLGRDVKVIFGDHHLSHAAAAFYPSPYQEAAILTIDGVGEWSTTTFGVGKERSIELFKEIRFPNSVGLLYSAFTYFTGFKINSGEYKLMGLAPYGRPIYYDRIMEQLIHVDQQGAITLNQKYFNYIGGLKMTNDHFNELFDGPPRQAESDITQREMDLAASIQKVLNEVVLTMARHVRQETGQRNLVISGGVALNVVSSGLLTTAKIFDEVWIQPAAGDAGSALGVALWHWHQNMDNPRIADKPDSMKGSLLGPAVNDDDAADDHVLTEHGAVWQSYPEDQLCQMVADSIANGKVVAVARGRMEFGPRALGSRSILGDARSEKMQSHMNLKIKFRESFRPFAPMVLAEDAADYFDMAQDSPYMLLAYPVLESRRRDLSEEDQALWGIESLKVPRSDIPAVTHVDYSARVQTIDKVRNPFIHGILSEFKKVTDSSVIINTSFNVRGEPIVNTAADAYRCFIATGIDCLVVGNRFLKREEQANATMSEAQRDEWLRRFDLD